MKQTTQPITISLTEKEIKTNHYDEMVPMIISADGVIFQNNFAQSPASLVKSILKFSKGTRSPIGVNN